MKQHIWFFFIALLLTSCKSTPQYPRPKHIVLIGLDGMSSQSLRETSDTVMPFYRSMMAKGSFALHKRSVLPSSSALNWASLYMAAGPEQHGFNAWDSRQPDFPSDTLTEHGIFPDIYYQIKKANPQATIHHYYEWDGMHYVVDTLSIDMDKQFNALNGELETVIKNLVTYKPLFTSIIFDSPDHDGHGSGWMSPNYIASLSRADAWIQQIYEATVKAGIADETVFVLTADHGGINKGHGGTSLQEIEAPVVFVGKGIRPGYEITTTVSISDVIPTLSVMLGLPRPHAWTGRPIWSIFQK